MLFSSILFPLFFSIALGKLKNNFENKSDKCAVFTVTRNEGVMLPIWIRYYANHFNHNDMWILDHESTDFSTSKSKVPSGVNIVRLHGDSFFMPHQFLLQSVERHQSWLLEQMGYGCTIFSETDEYIVADPAFFPGGLKEYVGEFLRNRTLVSVRPEGRDIIQNELESPLNWASSILSQRRYWGLSPAFSKTYLTKAPLHYIPGFHHLRKRADPEVTPSLKLLHLHFADTEYCLLREMHKHKESTKMHKEEVGLGAHFSSKFDELQRKPGGVCNASNVVKRFRPERMSARWANVTL